MTQKDKLHVSSPAMILADAGYPAVLKTMLHLIKRLFESKPRAKEIAPGIFIVGSDRDNWFMRLGERSTSIYAPQSSLWSSRRVDFYGISSDHWSPPHHEEVIPPEDKHLIENALCDHLKRIGIHPSIMTDDGTEAIKVVLID